MTGPRFTVERDDDNTTECECPEALCTHPEGWRSYTTWHVVVDDDPSPVATYDRKRDAVAAARKLNQEISV
jgi:hypothetical protein